MVGKDISQLDDAQELYEHYSWVVDKGQRALRIDKFLTDRIENASRTKIQTAVVAGSVLVNGKPVKSNYKVKPLDNISIVMAEPPREIELIPENIPLDIVYEDEHLIVVNKQAGLVVHPGYGNYTGTLVNALAYHIKDSELFKKDNIRPGLVHRIDKNTSGLLVVAKTELALLHLAKQFYEHTTERKYRAIVWGDFKENEGTITGYLDRDKKDRKKMYVYENEEEGKWSVTLRPHVELRSNLTVAHQGNAAKFGDAASVHPNQRGSHSLRAQTVEEDAEGFGDKFKYFWHKIKILNSRQKNASKQKQSTDERRWAQIFTFICVHLCSSVDYEALSKPVEKPGKKRRLGNLGDL